MALFSRRELQRLIDENAPFMRSEQVEEHVRRLNTIRDDYLSTEWEIALLNAFSRIGTVQHEPHIGGQKRLDLVFRSSSGDFEFAADVSTVSDQQLRRRNPVEAVWAELHRLVYKRGIRTGGFRIDVGPGSGALQGRGVRHDLLLPPIGQLRQGIFNKAFQAFLVNVKRFPMRPATYRIVNATTNVSIQYDPGRKGMWSGSHALYTGANIIDDNPVFNSLRNKAKKLKESNYHGPRGVIVCDGGCQMLSRRTTNWAEFSLDEVITEFLRQNQSVAFVIAVGTEHDSSLNVGRGRYRPSLKIGINRRFQPIYKPLRAVVEQMMVHLPTLETSPQNAIERVRHESLFRGAHFGGMELTGKKIRFSAITLQQLLAGELDYSVFANAHGFDRPIANPFKKALTEGRVITRCAIERSDDEDDDWVTFEFGEVDPALAAFRSPRIDKSQQGPKA